MKNYEVTNSYYFKNMNEDTEMSLVLKGMFVITVIMLIFMPIYFLFILFMMVLYILTDKEWYSEMIDSELVSSSYIRYRKRVLKKRLDNISKQCKKYQINDITTSINIKEVYEKNLSTYSIIQNRGSDIYIYRDPFRNCQSFSIANFKGVIQSSNKDYLVNTIKECGSRIYKNQVVIDINERYEDGFDELAEQYGFYDIRKMKYRSTNDSRMIIIKFVFEWD